MATEADLRLCLRICKKLVFSLCGSYKAKLCFYKLPILSRVLRKPAFYIYEKTKAHFSCAVTAQLIRSFVFATKIVQSLYLLNPKFKASNHLLCLYSPVYQKPGKKVFSQQGSNGFLFSFPDTYFEFDPEAEKAHHKR